MQTFLPYPSFYLSAKCLDWRRLGKQRSEAITILNSNLARKNGVKYGWQSHPATRMWENYLPALVMYYNTILQEWIDRGRKNNMPFLYPEDFGEINMPKFMGNNQVHSSHRGNLLRKDYEYYSKFGWTEKPIEGYVWIIE